MQKCFSFSIIIYQANQKRHRTSFVNNLNLDGTNYGSGGNSSADHSFGISGATLENTFGFKMDLENFQSANANIEVILHFSYYFR